MKTGIEHPRRLVAGVFLLLSLGMLVSGTTFLAEKLSSVGFIVYWLICFVLTGFAAIIALAEMFLLRRKLRREQLDLLEKALKNAQQKESDDFPTKE